MTGDRLLIDVDTPFLRIDSSIMEANIERFQMLASSAGVSLRPHVKTHKATVLAEKQLRAGAIGLTCATLSEAVGLIEGGVSADLFISVPFYPHPGKRAMLDRIIAAGSGISVAVDNVTVAGMLAGVSGANLTLIVEIDSGLGRTGVVPEQALAVAQACGAKFGGIFTHGGHGYPPGAADAAGNDEIRMLDIAKTAIERGGLYVDRVSAGSTPTAEYCRAAPVNEIRPGTYLFGDWQQVRNGAMSMTDVAAAVVSTIISTPNEDRFVIDAGAKSLSKDQPGWVDGYGHIVSSPHAIIERIYDNHAVVLAQDHSRTVGDQVVVIPNHICPVVNLFDVLWLTAGNMRTAVPVDLRGHVT